MASKIILHNNLITVHNGGTLSAVAPPKALRFAHFLSDTNTTTTSISTVEDISLWSVGDTVVFTPTTDRLSALDEKRIVSIEDSSTFTIDTPIEAVSLSAIPADLPHITNISSSFIIGGKDSTYRGGMRVLDSAKLDISNIEFKYWGIPSSPSTNGIVLLANKTNVAKISACTLNNDGARYTRFVSMYEDGTRTAISDLNFQNNIVYNTGDRGVLYNLSSPLSADLNLNNNVYIDSSVFVSNLSSDTLSADGLIFIKNSLDAPSIYIDCEDIQTLNFKNINLYANSDGAHLYRLSHTTVSAITALYNDFKGIALEEPYNVVVQDVVAAHGSDTGVFVYKSNDSLLVQRVSSVYNGTFNVFVDSISLNITPVSTISSTMTDGGQYGLFYSGYSPLLIDSLTATNNANIGIWAVLDTSSHLTSNSVTAVSSYLTGNREGINIASTNALYLTSNNILLANNIINNNLIGVKATNVAGVVSGNTFNFNTEDLNLTIGNNSTVINNNSATTHLSIADYKHLNITGGINYKDINVHTNTITLSDYNIVSTGINLLKFEGPSVLHTWPVGGIPLNFQHGAGAIPDINQECILFYYTDPGIKYFKINYSGPAYSSRQWRTAVYKNDTLIRVLPIKNSIKIPIPPTTNTTQIFNKFLLIFEKTDPIISDSPKTVQISIQSIQYSYDNITYMDIDLSTLYFNNNITYSASTSPETIINTQGIKNTYTNLITLGNTNFKNFRIYNVQSPPYINFDLNLNEGLVTGSYLLSNITANVNPYNIQTYYQAHTEKSTGIVCTSENNSSSYFKNGYILRNNTNQQDVNDQNNAPAEVMYPYTTSKNKLKSSRKYIAVRANESTSVYAYVKKSKYYNGAAPRLMISKNTTLGVLEDTALAVHDEVYGIWRPLVGTTVPALRDGVFEFYVDCDGTTGFVAVDSWASPIRNITGVVKKNRFIVHI